MSGYNNFEFDSAGIKRALEGIRGNAEAPKEAKARFTRLEGEVDDWNGVDDEFFGQTEPQWLAQNESCGRFVDGVGQFLVGLESAVNESMRSVGRTQGAAEDELNDARLNADNYRDGGRGKR